MANGAHSNPVWSTFIFVLCMLLFLFYLETMVRPMDFLTSRSFVISSPVGRVIAGNRSAEFVSYRDIVNWRGDSPTDAVLVFLHLQKTAGKAYNAHLALDIGSGPHCTCPGDSDRDLLTPAACQCDLEARGQSTWLFSRLTVGWPCGVHPGWTDLTTSCLNKELNSRENRTALRRYFLLTMLREPVSRYVNEWTQVSSHGQWPIKKIYCHPLEDKPCFHGVWTNVSFDEFLHHCPNNPANNRQVRMLSDTRSVPCQDTGPLLGLSAPRDNNTLLDSAKRNLQDLPFFGLLEYPKESDALFEHVFGVEFERGFEVKRFKSPIKLTAEQHEAIQHNNALDIELYKWAKVLFFERYQNLTASKTLL